MVHGDDLATLAGGVGRLDRDYVRIVSACVGWVVKVQRPAGRQLAGQLVDGEFLVVVGSISIISLSSSAAHHRRRPWP